MRKIETVDGSNWKEFVESPVAVLMLSKSDCANCARWTEELDGYLTGEHPYGDVRFGKMVLDRRGLIEFKKANPWIAELTDLPYNVIWRGGERGKSWAGGGVERMIPRLDRTLGRAT